LTICIDFSTPGIGSKFRVEPLVTDGAEDAFVPANVNLQAMGETSSLRSPPAQFDVMMWSILQNRRPGPPELLKLIA
jgi:hypothetical protein